MLFLGGLIEPSALCAISEGTCASMKFGGWVDVPLHTSHRRQAQTQTLRPSAWTTAHDQRRQACFHLAAPQHRFCLVLGPSPPATKTQPPHHGTPTLPRAPLSPPTVPRCIRHPRVRSGSLKDLQILAPLSRLLNLCRVRNALSQHIT